MKKEHDYFSLVYILRTTVTVVKEKKLKYWNRVCDFLDNGDINKAIKVLNKKKSFSLKVINYDKD